MGYDWSLGLERLGTVWAPYAVAVPAALLVLLIADVLSSRDPWPPTMGVAACASFLAQTEVSTAEIALELFVAAPVSRLGTRVMLVRAGGPHDPEALSGGRQDVRGGQLAIGPKGGRAGRRSRRSFAPTDTISIDAPRKLGAGLPFLIDTPRHKLLAAVAMGHGHPVWLVSFPHRRCRFCARFPRSASSPTSARTAPGWWPIPGYGYSRRRCTQAAMRSSLQAKLADRQRRTNL